MTTTKTTAIIVGAGQAGLAMSRELVARGVDHVVLEKGVVANAWRADRWESLRLLTPNWANGLPGAPYQGPDPSGFMSAGELADSFARYAVETGAPIKTQTTVLRATRAEDGFWLETEQGAFHGKTLVSATGACARPHIPALAADIPGQVMQFSPTRYKRPGDLPEGGVLIVGASATGAQLAREVRLSGRPVTLAVGAHIRLPRIYGGVDIEWWLDAIGVLDETWDAVEDLERARRASSPQLVGGADPIDLNALQDLGVEIVGRLAAVRKGVALFSGGLAHLCAAADLKQSRLLDQIDQWRLARGLAGSEEPLERPAPTRSPRAPRLEIDLASGEFRSVIWATGYRPDFRWLDLPAFDPRGCLLHSGGVVAVPGVYALGLPLLRRRRSHQISGVGHDAKDLADHLIEGLAAKRAA